MDLLDWAGLAATTSAAALLQAAGGFGFAVLATPLFLLFVDPPRAIQLVIIISTALSLVTLPGLWRAIAPALMLRLALGSLVGLPLGLRCLPFCRSGSDPRAGRSDNFRLCRASRVEAAAWRGRIHSALRHEARHRNRDRDGIGYRQRSSGWPDRRS